MSLSHCTRSFVSRSNMTRSSTVLSLLRPHKPFVSNVGHRSFSTTLSTPEQQQSSDSISTPPKKTPIGQIQRRLQITFTCTAQIPATTAASTESNASVPCHHRSTHEFSRRSYEHGIVLVECPSCKNRHLIGEVQGVTSSRVYQNGRH